MRSQLVHDACPTTFAPAPQVKHVMDEKRLLARMKHPFVVQLFGTFQDEECVYMVMEFVPGGEFFTLMRDRGR